MTSRYSDYDNWAWLYNQTMGPEYSQPQETLLARVFLPHIPPNGDILDLCCGTGQLIEPLVTAGYNVTGLDGSDDMIAYARRNAPQAHYLVEDARTFDQPNAFDGVFSTSASLNHLMSLTDLTQVFNRVFSSLRQGGVFVFDLNHPDQLERWWRGQPTEGEIYHNHAWMITPSYDSALAKGQFKVTIFQSSEQGNTFTKLLSSVKQSFYKILSRPRFIGLRLKLLQNFSAIEPPWQKKELIYPVKGHDLNQVKVSLETVGFQNIEITTIDGSSEIDSNHSAHFICTKPVCTKP